MNWIILVGTGICTGILSGLFGIGGGIILVPLLIFAFQMPQHTATGTSLVALLLPVGILGVLEYYRAGKITYEHLRFGILIAVGLLVGTYLGAKLALMLSPQVLRRCFSFLLAYVAVRFWLMK
jgi:uncharacterized membrane protein YfcA